MFEGIRRDLAHRRAAKEKERLKKIEVERRLSYIKTKRLEERKAAETGLIEQVGAERTALGTAQQALAERKQMEKELRGTRGPGTGMRVVRGIGRGTKTALYDIPVKAIRIGAKVSKSGNLDKILVGDTHFVLGVRKPTAGHKRPAQSLNEFLFGPSAKSPEDKPTDNTPDILS